MNNRDDRLELALWVVALAFLVWYLASMVAAVVSKGNGLAALFYGTE